MMQVPGQICPVLSPWGKAGGGGRPPPAGPGPAGNKPDSGQPRRAYHHGRLKEALIEAARALIERHGPQGFTLSEAAKLAGVTTAAPYRHFTDRDALMGEVATRGFEQFGARLAGAWDEGRPDAIAALQRIGRAYLAFARDEPGFYFTMFGHSQRLSEQGSIAAEKSFNSLANAAAAVLRERNAPISGARSLAYEIWAASHGVATLGLGRFLEPDKPESDPVRVLDSAVSALIERAVWVAGRGT
ncbi:MAG: TetR/AcrR family transcriptional regulator [Beijerinckiaceae bacterium]|jgi:AcrR family transcriptional regulator|nr:TetR/AcrR family transcriptional regulator [Beijerinckiaceae bacterium]